MTTNEPGPCDYWWSVILTTLEARANDSLEPEAEDIERAAVSIVAATMLGVGVEPDEVMRLLSETELDIYMAFDPEAKRVVVDVDWGDDHFEVTADIDDLT